MYQKLNHDCKTCAPCDFAKYTLCTLQGEITDSQREGNLFLLCHHIFILKFINIKNAKVRNAKNFKPNINRSGKPSTVCVMEF